MKALTILLVLAVLLLAGCAKTSTGENPGDTQDTGDGMNVSDTAPITEGESLPEGSPDVTFVLTGQNFKFTMDGVDNPDLRVKVGQRVKIKFSSSQGFHDWVVDEFSAATSRVSAPDSTSVEFIANTAGTFEYYCSVGSHRAEGMKGKLIVE